MCDCVLFLKFTFVKNSSMFCIPPLQPEIGQRSGRRQAPSAAQHLTETAPQLLHPAGRPTVRTRSNAARVPQKEPEQLRSSEPCGGSEQQEGSAAFTCSASQFTCSHRARARRRALTAPADKAFVMKTVSRSGRCRTFATAPMSGKRKFQKHASSFT